MLLKSHKERKMWSPLCYYIAPVGEKVEMLVVSHMISQNYGFEGRRVLDFMLNVVHSLFFLLCLGLFVQDFCSLDLLQWFVRDISERKNELMAVRLFLLGQFYEKPQCSEWAEWWLFWYTWHNFLLGEWDLITSMTSLTAGHKQCKLLNWN